MGDFIGCNRGIERGRGEESAFGPFNGREAYGELAVSGWDDASGNTAGPE